MNLSRSAADARIRELVSAGLLQAVDDAGGLVAPTEAGHLHTRIRATVSEIGRASCRERV